MPKDIRSYFSTLSSKKGTQSSNTQSPVKRRAVPLSSDEDASPSKEKHKEKNSRSKKTTAKNASKKRRIIDSDEEIEATPPPSKISKKPSLNKLKPAFDEKKIIKDIEPFLDDIPKRSNRKNLDKTKETKTFENFLLDDDDEFEKSVLQVDDEMVVKKAQGNQNGNVSKGETSKSTTEKVSKKDKNSSPAKESQNGIKEMKKSASSETKPKEKTLNKTPEKIDKIHGSGKKSEKSPIKAKSSLCELIFEESSTKTKTSHDKTPKEKLEKKSEQESSGLTDEERHERKRLCAVLYQKYKNRQSVINPGSKEIPKGRPNCLAGLSFLVTGILESMEREEANTLIKNLGGKISSTVGKRLNYMVVGEEAGPKKLATAEELGIKILSEDDLLNLIREKSGGNVERKTDVKPSSSSSSVKKELSTPKKEKKVTPEKRKIEQTHKEVTEKKIKKESPKKTAPVVKTENAEQISNEIIKTEASTPIIKPPENIENLAWVERYKPTNIKQIIGQQGAASNVVKLKNWLSNWYTNHDGKKKLQRPNPWAKNDDGSYYKAALLSGPPGVGKTTTATLVCQELGFDIVEFNASDTRSKKLLKQEVSELLSNKSLYGYCHGEIKRVTKKHVLLMDEVDGMAGNEDRGGIQELINLIKESSIPIVCMCNDRNHPKMRSLVNYCYDLRFNRPRLEQIKGAMMSICYRENIKLPPQKVEEIITATNHDIRQTINYLAMISAGKELNLDNNKNETAKKDLKLGPWEVVRKVFSAEEHKHMTLNDKCDLFFNDYSLGPLFVQQNYLQVMPKVPKNEILQQVAKTADSLSLGDLIEKRIRSNSAWVLLPVQAMFSSVLPGEYMAGHFTGQVNFPAWLGKYSKTSKRSRMAQEIHNHTRIRTSGSRLSIRLDYAPFILDAIVRPLKEHGLDGVEKSLEVIKEYRLLREDIETLIELTTWPGKKNPMDGIDGKVKAALTRAYNKEILPYSYSVISGIKKKKAAEADDVELEFLEGEEEYTAQQGADEDNEDDDKLENDLLIKTKKKPTSKTSNAEPSTSKGDSKKTKTKAASSSKGKGKK